MRKFSILIILLTGWISMSAATKTEGDNAYKDNNFKQAIEIYEGILNEGKESAELYYNLGNCYYKENSIAKAILNYERALLLSPGDEEARFNLDMAKSKTLDKVTPKSEVFIITWMNSVRDMMSESSWAKTAISCFILFLIGLAAYIFGKKLAIKKTGFSVAVIFLFFTVVAHLFAGAQKDKMIIRNASIVMQPTVTAKSTPDESGTDLFVLHEGTKVFIQDDSMNEWKEVTLEDGSRGWVPAESIEQI